MKRSVCRYSSDAAARDPAPRAGRDPAARTFAAGVRAAAAAMLAALAAAPGGAAQIMPPTYTATYDVAYKGRDVGSSEFSVSYDETRGVYTFRSHTRVKGMLRLFSPNAVVERSEFVVEHGRLRPLEFWYEDGSRKGKDNYHAQFDWEAGKAVIEGEKRVELDLPPGALDRGSMQVAVMVDMASGAAPGPYVLADEDSLKTYEYMLEGEQALRTPQGELHTVRYRQQRQGSSRSTVLWAAPSLDYLPVRIEQHRGGEAETVFALTAVEGLE